MKIIIYYFFIVILILTAGCSDSNKSSFFYSKDDDSTVPENKRYHEPDKPGIWKGLEAEHTASITFISKNKIEVTVPLRPSSRPKHYIESIMLMKGDTLIEAKHFAFGKNLPKATFTLKDESAAGYWIAVKCNNHGLWKSEIPKNPHLKQ